MSNKKRPSSEDVAKKAGVSRATVSAYLNNSKYVSPELVRRIERAIKKLNYSPDPLARALKMKDARTIGLIIPVMSGFFTPLMKALNDIAYRKGYGFLVCSSEEDEVREREEIEMLYSKRISGILIAPCSTKNEGLIRRIMESGTPVVQVNRRIDGLATDSIVSDSFGASYRATEHLIRNNRRHIALLGHDSRTLAGNQKRLGFEKALADNGVSNAIVVPVREHDENEIRASFIRTLESGQPIDGLICTTQGKTVIALEILKERALRIPDDIAVVGFDDSPWSSLTGTPLTVISENTKEMGERAAQLLLDRIEKRETGPAKRIVLEDEFIIRRST